jgi:hypothetical protein
MVNDSVVLSPESKTMDRRRQTTELASFGENQSSGIRLKNDQNPDNRGVVS